MFTILGFDTGYSEQQVLRDVDHISKAGLEHARLGEPNLPQVIKSPWLSDQIEEALGRGLRVSAAIVPMRNLFEAAESRRHVYRQAMSANLDAMGHPGSPWKVKDPMEQEPALAVEWPSRAAGRAKCAGRVLSFPRFVEDPGYFTISRRPFERHGVRARRHAVHKRSPTLARPSLSRARGVRGGRPEACA